ncbi:MAG: SRPBCC family protein [Rhodanobacter sp.]|jgi:mxaD protein|nr:SRPBCC family protein [Rhodanobacter sp.]
MLRIQTILGAMLAAGASLAYAAAPVLHVTKSATVNAPAAKVWDAVKDFNSLNTWHPAVASSQIVEGANNKVGAVRLLTLKGGGTIKEKLLGLNPAAHSFKYSILEGVLPVSDYTSTVSVKAKGAGKSVVTWSGDFKRKNTGDHPAANEDDKTATDTIGGVYQGGLDNLTKMFGS